MTIQTSNATMPFSDLMSHFEKYVEFPSDDGKRIASIGIGVNIEDNRQRLALVLRKLNAFSASDAAVTGTETEAKRNARYTRIIDRSQSILSSAVLNRLGSESAGTSSSELILRANLNAELVNYVDADPECRLDPASAVRKFTSATCHSVRLSAASPNKASRWLP